MRTCRAGAGREEGRWETVSVDVKEIAKKRFEKIFLTKFHSVQLRPLFLLELTVKVHGIF